ncbi:unnamed protein product [Adineta steineri]|uniref:Acyl-CoA dehydrogenase/oxidase C-terminal domain-containing protein n=1 Tax=Adineta steineri TaxID=433720 RepID=A0A814NIJ2_9BILA|nr:unnamed protein product [Adineta steineri]CAF1094129.1 unnamed protein product [Adineta steineri]
MTTSDLTINDLPKDGKSAKVIYSKLHDYTVQPTEPMNYSNTHTQLHQPQSAYNIDSSSPSIYLNQNIFQYTEKISNYTMWSIINIFCCSLCLGCIALHYSNKTKDLKRSGHVQDALKTSKKARNINIIATVTAVRAADKNIVSSKDSPVKATQSCLDGNGYINDYPTSRLLRDAKLCEIGAGISEIRRLLIGRSINGEYGIKS